MCKLHMWKIYIWNFRKGGGSFRRSLLFFLYSCSFVSTKYDLVSSAMLFTVAGIQIPASAALRRTWSPDFSGLKALEWRSYCFCLACFFMLVMLPRCCYHCLDGYNRRWFVWLRARSLVFVFSVHQLKQRNMQYTVAILEQKNLSFKTFNNKNKQDKELVLFWHFPKLVWHSRYPTVIYLQ